MDYDKLNINEDKRIDEQISAKEQFKIYLTAAEQDDCEAQYQLACCYSKGNGVESSSEKAFDWFLKAAQQGHAKAQYEVALFYEPGCGAEESEEMKAILN